MSGDLKVTSACHRAPLQKSTAD